MSGVADRTGLDSRLIEVAHQYDAVQADLARPETSTDPDAIRRLGKELSRLEPVVAAFRRLEATRAELAGASRPPRPVSSTN
jgi:protein subunit release factor A